MGDLIIRNFKTDDKEQLVEVAKKNLSKEFSVKRWDWLYNSPENEGSHIIVAEYDGQAVGSVGAIKKRFVLNGEEYIGGRHVDPVVDVSMRGKGVFTKMLKVLNEVNTDVDFIYTFPNKASFRGFEKMGYTSAGPLPVGYCHMGFQNAGMKDKIKYFKTGFKLCLNNHTNVVKGSIEDLKDAVWKMPADRYALVRDYRYISWRYGKSPIKNYDVLICRNEKEEILNACVVTQKDDLVCLVDLLEYTEPIAIENYLVAVRQMYGPVTAWLWKNNVERKIDSYFWARGQGHNFMVRVVNKEMPQAFFDHNNWFLSHGEVESN